jgi:hypothetical protein
MEPKNELKEPNEYDVEQEQRCVRCGSTRYLLMEEEESKEIFCSPCWKALHRNPRQPSEPTEEADKLDFYL